MKPRKNKSAMQKKNTKVKTPKVKWVKVKSNPYMA